MGPPLLISLRIWPLFEYYITLAMLRKEYFEKNVTKIQIKIKTHQRNIRMLMRAEKFIGALL
jgi:hypothetical protein